MEVWDPDLLSALERQELATGACWEDILARFNIVYRRRSTGVLVGLCIFHQERTPSLHFWPRSCQFHCHGCGIGGDMVRFAWLLYRKFHCYPTREEIRAMLGTL